jgi:hypothetical protein
LKRIPILLLAAASAACSTVGHEKVEGWPELTIVEHRVSAGEMYDRCKKYVAFGMLPMACAEFNLATKRCDIWLMEGFAPRSIVEHERLHCQGHDHVGETAMRDFLTRYRAATSGVAAAAGTTTRPATAAEAAN